MSVNKTRIRSESEFQDDRVAKGGKYRKFQHLIKEEYPHLLTLLGDVRGKRILTMGCSTGGVTPFAREHAWTLGVDISQLAMKELSQSISDEGLSDYANVAIMDCENLGVKKECFDAVLFFGVLHHLDMTKAITESYRVLKPGGKVYMSEPLGLHPIINLYRRLTPNLRTKFEHPLTPKDFRIMREYFNIEHFKGFCLTSILSLIPLYLFQSDRLYELARKFFIRTDELLFSFFGFLRYFAWSAVIVLSKKDIPPFVNEENRLG